MENFNFELTHTNLLKDLRELVKREGFEVTKMGFEKKGKIQDWYVVELTSPEKGVKDFRATSLDGAITNATNFLLEV